MEIGEGVIRQGRTQHHSTIVNYHVLASLRSRRLSPHIRESRTVLDSGFRIPGTGFQNLSVEFGFWIPIVSGNGARQMSPSHAPFFLARLIISKRLLRKLAQVSALGLMCVHLIPVKYLHYSQFA